MTQSRLLTNMFLTTVKIRLLGQYLSIALSSSHLMACLLVSLPHSSKCANQEKLNLTCNVRGLQIRSNAISNDKDMGEKSKTRKFFKRDQESDDLWLPLAGSLLDGGLVASAVHL